MGSERVARTSPEEKRKKRENDITEVSKRGHVTAVATQVPCKKIEEGGGSFL